MTALWIFLFPLIAILMVVYFIYRFNRGVRAGIFQKSIFRRKQK